jgi:streptomycin 6-kinase
MSDEGLVPAGFAQHIREVFKEEADPWLASLPVVVAELATRWRLEVGPPVANLSYNWVAPATRFDGTPAMLKIGVPSRDLEREMAALRCYDGHGISHLLEADSTLGALLLERLEPGTTLIEVALRDDDEATRIAAGVMRQLWRPVPPDHGFVTVADWREGFNRLRAAFDGTTGPLPERLVLRAEAIYAELQANAAPSVLLHGDLHHDNILRARRAPWLAIDPKGVVGEPAYETYALFYNPIPHLFDWPDKERIFARRASILAEELGFDRERLLGWAFYGMVLSAIWTIEDEGYGWEPMIACAKAVERVMRDEG